MTLNINSWKEKNMATLLTTALSQQLSLGKPNTAPGEEISQALRSQVSWMALKE